MNHIFDSTFLSVAAARRARVPLVGSITTVIQHQTAWKQKLLEVADRCAVGLFGVRQWDGIVNLDRCVDRYVRRLYGREAAGRSVIIPFGARLESMERYEQAGAERPQDPTVLFVGHIHPFRNPVRLVRAMPLVLKTLPRARLVLAGRVDLEEPVRAAREIGLPADRVTFLGETPHEEAVEWMKRAHVFASWVTGPYPGLGTAPMEAMLCRTPVMNDLPEDLFGPGRLRHAENIWLVDSKDPSRVADGLLRLLTDEALRRRIGEAGRRFVLEHLSWDSIAASVEAFYGRILGAKAPENPKKTLPAECAPV